MIIKETLNEIRSRWRDLYPADRHGGIICPLCGSGSGPNGTGITEYPKGSGNLRCWKCDFHGDVFNLIQQQSDCDFKQSVERAAQTLGLSIESLPGCALSRSVYEKSDASTSVRQPADTRQDWSAQYTMWTAALRASGNPGAAYLISRGISVETAAGMGVGYASDWMSPKAVAEGKTIPSSPRLIFPKGPSAYATRDVRPVEDMDATSAKYIKQNQGKGGLFHAAALMPDATDPVIVCEGPMDALSVAEVGYNALALCGTSGRTALLDMLRENPTEHMLLIALDADDAGRIAADRLREELTELGVLNALCSENTYLGCKDLNEAHCKDSNEFALNLHTAVDSMYQQIVDEKHAAERQYVDTCSAVAALGEYDAWADTMHDISTGFLELDRLLDGGLYPALYVIGAVSSLGKTSFCLQMADQIAASGRDVVFFSLEMSRNELIARSLSRLTYMLDLQRGGNGSLALTTRSIISGAKRRLFSAEMWQLYHDAFVQYRNSIAEHLYIIHGIGNITAFRIQEMVHEHIRITGRHPVVMVDYMQIIAPTESRGTDKQNTDKAVFTLKNLSADEDVPVICISSFNRESYTSPVTFSSFKESGAIEYSSDILLGLQYAGMDAKPGETDMDRRSRVMDSRIRNELSAQQGQSVGIELKLLKNRNGTRGVCQYQFTPRYNHYAGDAEYCDIPWPGERSAQPEDIY